MLPLGLETLEVNMKVFKSLLLGSAAGLVAVAGASAADLGVKKPTPVEYVRVCSIIPGHTGFVIPGTDICLRVGGRVRAELRYFEPFDRNNGGNGNTIELFTRAQMEMHAVSQTEYGPLQAFVRYQLNVGRGQQIAGGDAQARIDAGFINWAGFTVGRAPSFYDFTGGHIFGNTVFSDVNPVNVFAYTANFGGGFTASIAIEDALQTRSGPSSTSVRNGVNSLYAYGGQRMPDIIANVRLDQAWGSAMLSGGVHQLFSGNFVPVSATFPGPAAPLVDTEYGWGINAGVKINLPFLAAGDFILFAGSYSEGWLRGAGGNNSVTGSGPLGGSLARGDAFVDALGRVHKTQAFAGTVQLRHNWTPTLRSDATFSYADINYDAIGTVVLPGNVRAGFVDYRAYQVGANLQWLPVRGLTIGAEVNWIRIDPQGRVADVNRPGFTIGEEDRLEARLRVQRDF